MNRVTNTSSMAIRECTKCSGSTASSAAASVAQATERSSRSASRNSSDTVSVPASQEAIRQPSGE
jgi:hypothetical protein